MQVKRFPDKIIDLILAILVSFSFIYASTTSAFISYSPVKTLLFTAVFSAVYFIIFYNKASLKISAVVIGVAFLSTLIYLINTHTLPGLIFDIKTYAIWLYDYIAGYAANNSVYEFYTVLILCASIPLPVLYFTVKKFNFFIILASGIIIFSVQWTYEYFQSYLSFYLFVFLILVYYFKHIYMKNSSSEPNEYMKPWLFTIWLFPFCALIFALSYTISAPDKPVEWKWLDRKINTISHFFEEKYAHPIENFTLTSTGFGQQGSPLGGKVRLDRTVVLKVEAPRVMYLKGAIYDTYTGVTWTKTDSDKISLDRLENNISPFDTVETALGLQLLTRQRNYMEENFYKDTVKISYVNLKTKSLFVPSKSQNITLGSGNPSNFFIDRYGMLTSGKLLGQKFNYSVSAYSIKYNTDLENILRQSRRGLYSSYSRRTRGNVIPTLSQLADTTYEQYLQLPPTLPGRVKELSNELTATFTNNYDKVKAIEYFLSKNYPYTLTPKSTPRGRDFVDYFLFDLKQGYCTYYATAMTIMARSIGIPARYVEGYILPPSPSSGSTYDVTNEQAHAWVEVYFEGFGWLPFEPTAPFAATFYNTNEFTGQFSGDFLNNENMEEYLNHLRGYNSLDTVIPPPDTAEQVVAKKTNWWIVGAFNLGCIIIVFGLLVLFNIIKSRLRIRKMLRMQSGDCVRRLYAYYMDVLSLQRLGLRPGETPYQYADRIDLQIIFYPVRFKAVTGVFVKARYSGLEISEADRKVVADFYTNFLERVKRNMGKVKYFVFMYILGRV